MAWEYLDVHSPRPDTRPPGFAKGQSFGPVPHTRVRIVSEGAEGAYSFMNDGIILPVFSLVGTTGNEGLAVYGGRCAANGETWRVGFTWQVVDKGSFEVLLRAAIFRDDLSEQSNWYATIVNKHLAGTFGLTQNTSTPVPGTPLSCTKMEVPEWSAPLEFWPGSHLANIPLGQL